MIVSRAAIKSFVRLRNILQINTPETAGVNARSAIAILIVVTSRAAAGCVSVETPRENSCLQSLAELNVCAGVISIPNQAIFIGVKVGLTNTDSEIVVIALRPAADEIETPLIVVVILHVVFCVNTRPKEPMVVDMRGRLQAENKGIVVVAVLSCATVSVYGSGAVAVIGIFDFAVPNDTVGVFLQFGEMPPSTP